MIDVGGGTQREVVHQAPTALAQWARFARGPLFGGAHALRRHPGRLHDEDCQPEQGASDSRADDEPTLERIIHDLVPGQEERRSSDLQVCRVGRAGLEPATQGL